MKRELLALLVGTLLGQAGRDPSATEVGWDFYEKGAPRVRVEMQRDAEGHWARAGHFQQWYENGNLEKAGPMEAGHESGPWIKYFESGKVRKRLSYRAGKIHGDYESFYENGQQASTGQFEDGQPAGEWSVWNEDGSVNAERSGRYEGGELVPD